MENLVREAVKVPEQISVADEEKELARQAKDVLGYSTMFREYEDKKVSEHTILAAEVFKKLGIEPFSDESVKKYKGEVEKKLNLKGRVVEALDGRLGAWLFFGAVAAAIVSALMVALMSDWSKNHHSNFSKDLWFIPIVFASIAVITLIVVVSLDETPHKEYYWDMIPLSNCQEKVPAFALSRALELKREVPSCYFYVDSLRSRDRYVDPFLVVEIGFKKYYIDVWDEAKFEGRRIK